MSCGGWIERAHTIKISSVSVLPCRNLDSAGGRSRWAWNEGNTGCRLDAKPARTGRTGRISRVRGECLVDRMFGGSGSNRFVLPMTGPGTDRHGRPLPDSHRKGLFGFGSEKIKDGRHPADAVRRRTIHSKKGPDEGSQGPGEVACHPPVNKKNITKSYARSIPR